jgi:lipooligosaccharide transport system permease protein
VRAAKVVRRNSLVFWRGWRWSLFLSVLSPVLFLSAMGLGIGALVARGDPQAFGNAGYVAFFATGMLAATCMQTGAFSATYPVMSRIRWERNYESMLSTPLGVRDLVVGELSWIALMLTLQVIPFFSIMIAFGVPFSAPGVLVIPVAILLGLACAAPVLAYTATLETDESYSWLFRFVLTPLFLLSGTFFPIDQLPTWAAAVANISPLYHGIELVRGLMLYDLSALSAVWHVAFLLLLLLISTRVAIRTMTRRLAP